MKNVLVIAREACDSPAPAAFEAIHTRHCSVCIVSFRDAPEIVAGCAAGFGLANGFPLQQVIGHEITMLVARGTIEINGLARHASHEDAGQQLPLVFGQQKLLLLRWRKNLPCSPVVVKAVDAKVVTLTGDLQ